MSSYGLSVLGCVLVSEISCATSIPLVTRPNTVCLLSNQGYKEGEACIHIMLCEPLIHTSYCGYHCDEELGAISVRPCIGHAHNKWPIMFEHGVQLIFKFSTPDGLPTCPRTCKNIHATLQYCFVTGIRSQLLLHQSRVLILVCWLLLKESRFCPLSLLTIIHACWVSSLDHKLLYDAMEYVPTEVAITSMHTEVLHSLGAAIHIASKSTVSMIYYTRKQSHLLFRKEFDLYVPHGCMQSHQRTELGTTCS